MKHCPCYPTIAGFDELVLTILVNNGPADLCIDEIQVQQGVVIINGCKVEVGWEGSPSLGTILSHAETVTAMKESLRWRYKINVQRPVGFTFYQIRTGNPCIPAIVGHHHIRDIRRSNAIMLGDRIGSYHVTIFFCQE